MRYRILIEPDDNDTLLVTCPDLPEVTLSAVTRRTPASAPSIRSSPLFRDASAQDRTFRPRPMVRASGPMSARSSKRRWLYTGLCAGTKSARPISDGRGRRPSTPGTWRWLCERYFASSKFRHELDVRTRRVRRQILEATFMEPVKPGASAIMGDCPIRLFSAQAVRALRDRKAVTPEAANSRLKAIRQVFAYGLDGEPQHVKSNPARDVSYFRTGSPGFHTWTIDEVRQFEERHPVGTKARLALALLLYVGGRRADIPALGRQHIRDGWLRYTQNKNRNRNPVTLDIPVLAALQRVIDRTPDARRHLTFLVTAFDKPFTTSGFGNKFRDWCNQAGLPHCSAHGLRKAGATIAAENGASEHQLMAIYGWRNPRQAAHYTKQARQKRLAGAAMHLLDLDETGNERPPLSRAE